MGWETRKGTDNAYYTRSRRVDGRIVREYFGSGPLGREAARRCDEIRELRDRKRRDDAVTLARLAAAERATDEYCRFVELALHAYMAECGYHYHRGEWRKRRVPKEKPAEEQAIDADASASERASKQIEPVRSRLEPSPARRPMPQRPMLKCRLGLVRGIVVFRSAKARALSERTTTISDAESRKGVGYFFRSGAIGTTMRYQCEKSTRPLQLSPGFRVRAPPAERTAGHASSGTQHRWQVATKQ